MAKPMRTLAKWVGIPAALAALGFFVIGPRIGTTPDKAPKPVQELVASYKNHAIPGASVVQTQPAETPVHTPAETPKPEEATPTTPPPPAAAQLTHAADSSDGPSVEVSVDGERTDRVERSTHRRTAEHHTKRTPTHRAHTTPKDDSSDDGSYGGTRDAGKSTPPDGN
jgi:hypothetical protein